MRNDLPGLPYGLIGSDFSPSWDAHISKNYLYSSSILLMSWLVASLWCDILAPLIFDRKKLVLAFSEKLQMNLIGIFQDKIECSIFSLMMMLGL